MSFAIEVPAEAVPLNPQELYRALEAAGSNNHTQRQAATQQLSEWESHQTFFSTVQAIFLDKSMPHNIRFLAIILLKNGIDKRWRAGNVRRTISSAEKAIVRSRLLQGSIGEEERSLALHNALVTAKIARIDYPHDWPEAIPGIIGALRETRSGNPMHLNGALTVLLPVVKEFATARLRNRQTALQEVTPELVQLLGEIYAEKTAVWLDFLGHGKGDEDDADWAMQNTLVALKTLRRLLIFGYEYPHKYQTVQEFWGLSQTHFGGFLAHVSHDSPIPAPYQDVVGQHLLQFTKLHIDMSDKHPASFCFLPNSVSLVRAYWDLVANFAEVFDKSGGIRQASSGQGEGAKSKLEGPLLERLALKGLLLIKSCLAMVHRPKHTFKYTTEEARGQNEQAKELIKTGLLTDEFILQAVNTIITKLFVFRKSDLEAWEQDPEEWEAQEQNEGSSWEWEVRPCAEHVFVDFVIFCKKLLVQPLLSYFASAAAEDSDVVRKEAVMTAMGCAAAIIYENFDFDNYLSTTLVKDAQLQDPLAKILRRRIAILLSLWVPIKVADENKPLVYEIFRHFLNPEDSTNDEVVRITAARQLRLVADDFGFNPARYQPSAAPIFDSLIKLLGSVELEETKLAILETLRVLVTRMTDSVGPFADAIMSVLPGLWATAASEEYMIKQIVLAIVTALVTSIKGDSQRFQHFVLPLLSEALDPLSDLHLHLIEESVELWKALLTQSSPPLSPELLELVHLGLPLVEYDSDVSHQCLEIVKDYIILSPQAMLGEDLRWPILKALLKALDVRSREHVRVAVDSIQFMIRAAEQLGGTAGVAVVVNSMSELGMLRYMTNKMFASWQASNAVGANKKSGDILTVVSKTDYLTILARIAVADPSLFLSVLERFGPNNDFSSNWKWLSDEWFSTTDTMTTTDDQKLCCLALTRLTEISQEPMQHLVLSRLQDYLVLWTSVISDMQDGGQARYGDYLVWDPEPVTTEYDTPRDVCEREFARKDPVHTVVTLDFVKARLQDLVMRAGGEASFAEEWAANVDKQVLEEFKKLTQG